MIYILFGLLYYKSDNKSREHLVLQMPTWEVEKTENLLQDLFTKLFGNIICWATKTKYDCSVLNWGWFVALATCATEYLWLKNLTNDFDLFEKSRVIIYVIIYENIYNQTCIHSLKKWKHKYLKHVDIKYNFVKEQTSELIISEQINRRLISW